jgi:hypothetical protein
MIIPLFFFISALLQITALNQCKNCRHFITPYYSGKYVIGNYYGKCIKYTRLLPSTTEFDYVTTDDARNDESMCGKDGKKFEECNNKNIVNDCSSG